MLKSLSLKEIIDSEQHVSIENNKYKHMKNSKKVFGNVAQGTNDVKKSQKHDVNLQKYSSLYFQIGLILCLLCTYTLFEMQFQEYKIVIDRYEENDIAKIDVVEKFRVEPDIIPEKQQKQNRKIVLTNKIVQVQNDVIIKNPIEIIVSDSKPFLDKPIKIEDINVTDVPEEPVFVDFIKIENAPIYPGCEKYGTNDGRKKCMSQQIMKLVSRKFNTDLASQHGLTGVQKIDAQFTIDNNGNVVDIKARALHPALEKEAQRIINKIPHMTPGYQRDVAVGVIYNLPIKFQVQ